MGGVQKYSFGSIRCFFCFGTPEKIEKNPPFVGSWGDHSDGLIHRLIEVRSCRGWIEDANGMGAFLKELWFITNVWFWKKHICNFFDFMLEEKIKRDIGHILYISFRCFREVSEKDKIVGCLHYFRYIYVQWNSTQKFCFHHDALLKTTHPRPAKWTTCVEPSASTRGRLETLGAGLPRYFFEILEKTLQLGFLSQVFVGILLPTFGRFF